MGSLEEDVAGPLGHLMEKHHRVGDERAQPIGRGRVFGEHLIVIERGPSEGLNEHIVLIQPLAQLGGETLPIDQIQHAESHTGHLVAVGRANATLGGTNLVVPLLGLTGAVEFAVPREHHVRGLGDAEIGGRHRNTQLGQSIEFFDQTHGVHDHAIADHAHLVRAEDPTGDQVQDVLVLAHEDRMARVIATLSADDHVRLLGEDVDDLAFAFVAPLSADQNHICHG